MDSTGFQQFPAVHLFTVDVEEHFQVSAFEGLIERGSWDTQPSRVERNVGALLDLLARHGKTGTFFCLGWIADRYPDLVRRIAEAGHEIASHGWWHRRVTQETPDSFRQDVRDSKAILEDTVGMRILGYRAPSFSIVPGFEWALDVLIEEGYRYDSSLFPIRRRGYGYPCGEVVPHILHRPSGLLLELPPTTTMMAGMRVPAGGGGYFRQFPYPVTRHAFLDLAERGVSGTFFVHPWEIDSAQPRVPTASLVTRLRHYRGLTQTMPRLERLLAEFRFTSVADRFGIDLAGTESNWAATLPQ